MRYAGSPKKHPAYFMYQVDKIYVRLWRPDKPLERADLVGVNWVQLRIQREGHLIESAKNRRRMLENDYQSKLDQIDVPVT